jgi:hypothetical protein
MSLVGDGGVGTALRGTAPPAPPGMTVRAEVRRRPRADGRRPALAVARAVVRHLAAVAAFSVPAVVLWWHAWDGHLGSTLTCTCGDAGQEVWFIAWPAYALAHGLDPFFSSALQAPYGVNLLSNAAAVPVGLVLSPLTWIAGPVVATNVALTLCPGLSAWACWIACRRLTSWGPASVVAGVLYGYSPFVVTNLATGHVSLCLLVTPPLLLVAGRELLYGRPGSRLRWGAAIGALVALQFVLSSEILVITVLVGVPGGAAAVIGARSRLGSPKELLAPLGAACAVAVALLAFPVWLALLGPQHIVGPPWPGASLFGNPLSSLWDPGAYGASGDLLLKLGGYGGAMGPPSSYLGPVVLGLAGACLVVSWRRWSAWLLAALGGVCVVLSLGAVLALTPGRFSHLSLPWSLVGTWPLLEDVIPQRFSALSDLFVALVVGIGLDHWYGTRASPARASVRAGRSAGGAPRRTGRRTRALVTCALMAAGAAGIVSLWWTYQVPLRTTTVSVPRWFETAATRLPSGTTVLTYPFPFPSAGTAEPMVWQAVDGMRFRLAGGYIKAPGPHGAPLSDHPARPPYGVLAGLSTRAGGPLPTGTPAQVAAVRAALEQWGVEYVVVTDRGRDPRLAVSIFTAAIGTSPRYEDGAWVWHLRARL